MTSPAAKPDTIEGLASAVPPALAMLAGMQLDLFTPLKDGPMTTEQISDALGVGSVKLKPLLYALVAAELLTVEGELFSNTPEAEHLLVRGKPTYIGGRHVSYSDQWHAILKTAESIRIGSAQARHDFSTFSEGEANSFYRSRYVESSARGRSLVSRFDFSGYRSLVDVGGGSDGLAVAITEACPGLRATVVDLPTVTPITQRLVEEAGASERVQVMTADVVKEPLTGSFDVAVMSNFIVTLSPDQVPIVLKNVSHVTKQGGAIHILGHIIDDSHLSPLATVTFNLFFINAFDGGQAYTEQEHGDWLTEAGFEGIERVSLPNGSSIMSARKPG